MGSTLTGTLPNSQEEDEEEQQFFANFCPTSCRRIQTLTLQLWGHQWGLMEGVTPVSLCTPAEVDTQAQGATQATMATQQGILIHGRMMEATLAIRALTSTFYLSPQNLTENRH